MESHSKWIKNHIRTLQCKTVTYLLLQLLTIKTHEKLHKNVNENKFHSHFYANFHASVALVFLIGFFIKFSPKSRTK